MRIQDVAIHDGDHATLHDPTQHSASGHCSDLQAPTQQLAPQSIHFHFTSCLHSAFDKLSASRRTNSTCTSVATSSSAVQGRQTGKKAGPNSRAAGISSDHELQKKLLKLENEVDSERKVRPSHT